LKEKANQYKLPQQVAVLQLRRLAQPIHRRVDRALHVPTAYVALNGATAALMKRTVERVVRMAHAGTRLPLRLHRRRHHQQELAPRILMTAVQINLVRKDIAVPNGV
jgi:hypothetical protein